jgi:hypothetical protein
LVHRDLKPSNIKINGTEWSVCSLAACQILAARPMSFASNRRQKHCCGLYQTPIAGRFYELAAQGRLLSMTLPDIVLALRM